MKIKKNTSNEIVVALQTESSGEVDFCFPVAGEEQDLAPLFSGPLWSAIIWERSVKTMCNYLERNASEFCGKHVLELGCGLGVPGLVAGFSCSASTVFLTDRAEDLQSLEKALKANSAVTSQSPCKFQPVAYDWGAEKPKQLQADVILAVECVSADVYGKDSLEWLIKAICEVAKPGLPVLLFLCSARRKNDGLDIVLNELASLCIDANGPELILGYTDEPNSDVELYRIELKV